MSLSQSLFDLSGKTALITGGSSGLGAYFAEVLCDAGATVAIIARRADKLTEVADLVRSQGGTIITKTCDIVDADRVSEVVEEIWNELGRIDILVNNAAITNGKDADDLSIEEVKKVMDTNFVSYV